MLRELQPPFELPTNPEELPTLFIDTDGDDLLTLSDVLAVVQRLRDDLA